MELHLVFDDGRTIKKPVATEEEATSLLKVFVDSEWDGEQFVARIFDGEKMYEEDQSNVASGPFGETRVGEWRRVL